LDFSKKPGLFSVKGKKKGKKRKKKREKNTFDIAVTGAECLTLTMPVPVAD